MLSRFPVFEGHRQVERREHPSHLPTYLMSRQGPSGIIIINVVLLLPNRKLRSSLPLFVYAVTDVRGAQLSEVLSVIPACKSTAAAKCSHDACENGNREP
jgi:hypothetical protein